MSSDSLTGSVIKNTYWHLISQAAGLLVPLFLTPYIVSVIGKSEFGIYALVTGTIVTLGILDGSLSSSFIKFIAEYYNKGENENLSRTVNTGLAFYIIFSLSITTFGFFFTETLIDFLNIPPESRQSAIIAFRIGFLSFVTSSIASVFVAVLLSIRKMYINSFATIMSSVCNLLFVIIFLNAGFGLKGVVISQLFALTITNTYIIISAVRYLPQANYGLKYLDKKHMKMMSVFGFQMQTSRFASTAAEKYDEFLLGHFSAIGNVAYYNIASRLAKAGRMIPVQLIIQVSPIAAELKAKGEEEKIQTLFSDISRYLTAVSIPVFVYIIFFSELVMDTWMGKGFDTSSWIIKLLATGQLANMILSAPGNSITPSIGKPKFLMYEGLIDLFINLILSYILIRSFDVQGAAVGGTLSLIISSVYVFFVSTKFFRIGKRDIFMSAYLKPVLSGLISAIPVYIIYRFFEMSADSRVEGMFYIILTGIIFISLYALIIIKAGFFQEKDKVLAAKFLSKIFPDKGIFSGLHKLSRNK